MLGAGRSHADDLMRSQPHALAPREVAEALETDPERGLAVNEAGPRLLRNGPNRPRDQ